MSNTEWFAAAMDGGNAEQPAPHHHMTCRLAIDTTGNWGEPGDVVLLPLEPLGEDCYNLETHGLLDVPDRPWMLGLPTSHPVPPPVGGYCAGPDVLVGGDSLHQERRPMSWWDAIKRAYLHDPSLQYVTLGGHYPILHTAL